MSGQEEEDEELYADLFEHLEDGRQLPKTSLLQMEERMSQITQQTQDMQIQIDSLLKQNYSLQRDKDVLIRNISCLFKTAQMEIARKNKQINELREKISQLKMQEPHLKSLMPTEAQIKTKSEELLWDRISNKVQDNDCRETRHADALLEMDRLNPYDSKAMKKVSGDKSNCQKRSIKFNTNDEPHESFRDARRQRVVEDERRSLGGTHGKHDKDSFKGHHENRKEEYGFRNDKRECQSQEKLVQQGHDNGKDQQIMQYRKKDRVSYNEFRDYWSSGRRERDDRTSLRTATIRSMNESDTFSSDVSHAIPRNSGVKRKVADAVNAQRLNSYDDPSSYKIQKSKSFVNNRTDEKKYSNAEQ